MKFAFTALLSAAAALQSEMFLQEEINLTAENKAEDADTIGSGSCQAFFGDDIYDFKAFDNENRDKKHSRAAVISADEGQGTLSSKSFIYKACQNPFTLQKNIDWKDITVTQQIGSKSAPKCANEGNAYIVTNDGTTVTCANSFKNSRVSVIETTNADKVVERTGWNMVWTSQEECYEDKTKEYTVKVTATCNKNATDAPLVFDSSSNKVTCLTAYTYDSKNGCVSVHLPIAAVLEAVGPFFGVIAICFGALMTYAGAKFLFIVLSVTIALIVTSISFLLIFNLFVPVTASKGVVGGVLFLCVLVGALVTFLTYKITIKAAVPVLAGICGIMGAWALYRLTGIHKPVVRILFLVGGFGLGSFFGHKLQRHIKTIGTAFIGSNIIISGVSMYAGNIDVPNNADVKKVPTAFWGYLIGWIVLFVSGSLVQKKLFAAEDDKEDAFADEDEAKRCGCF